MKRSKKTLDKLGVSDVILKVQDLVHIYPNGTKALDSVSMDLKVQERLAIIGQNGSGKTTLVKHFNALLRPTSGIVSVFGKELTPSSKIKTSELAQYIGYVFQNPNHQLFSVNVYDELCFGLKNLRLAPEEIKAKADEAVELFNLQSYLKAHPYSLGMGVRKLVAIASIYAMGPDLIILDEPTTGQDFKGKEVLSQAISMIHERGKTLVFVSHDMRFVAEHAERVVVMTDAEILFEGSLQKLFIMKDLLTKAQLKPPSITELAQKMVPYGVKPDVLSVREMVEELQRCLDEN